MIALEKSVFTHIPKCGGSSVRLFLTHRRLDRAISTEAHALPGEAEKHGGGEWTHWDKPHWCLLREPGPWHWSHYHLILSTGVRVFNPAGELVRDRWRGSWATYQDEHLGMLGLVYERYASLCEATYPMEALLGSVLAALWRFEGKKFRGPIPFLNRGSRFSINNEHRARVNHEEPIAHQLWSETKQV